MIEKVKQALQSILDKFEMGDIPEAIAYSTFPIPNIPAAKWSLFIQGKINQSFLRDWQKRKGREKSSQKKYADELHERVCHIKKSQFIGKWPSSILQHFVVF